MSNALAKDELSKAELSSTTEHDKFAVVAERVSHALRTPLGVVRSLIEDASCGRSLTAQDFEDGLSAVRKLCKLTDVLSGFSRSTAYSREHCSLYPLLLTAAKDCLGATVVLASQEVKESRGEFSAQALHDLFAQLAEFASPEQFQLVLVEMPGTVRESQLRLIIKFPVEVIPLKAYPRASIGLVELAVQNHGWQGLRMLLIERIAKRAGWQVSISFNEPRAELVIDF